jgi:hypothetical protein
VSELVDKLFAIHQALESASLPHAFGGAISLAYCVEEPRGTRDLDVNVFCDAADAKRVLGALPDGVRVEAGDVERVERDGQARLYWDGVPVDVFLNNLPLHDDVAGAVVWVFLEGKKVPMLDCASLVLFKAFFNRTKDWADIEAIGLAAPEDIEAAAATIARLVGEDDPPSYASTRSEPGIQPEGPSGGLGVCGPLNRPLAGRQEAESRETVWLATMRASGSHLRLVSARRAQVLAGRIASTSQGRSAKLK